MMRFLFLILLIFPLFVLAEPGKVVGVIPVKFNSKGMHAPVPYNQQLMNRGWTRVPTLNLPFTYAGGAGQNPRYQPTKVTKKSFSRALGYAAGRAANMTPAGKALLIAYGAYEANCITENYPSLCFDGPEEIGTECAVGTPIHGVGCGVPAPSDILWRSTVNFNGQDKIFSRKNLSDSQMDACTWFLSASASFTTAGFRECTGGRSIRYKECNYVIENGVTKCDYSGAWKYSITNGTDYQGSSAQYYCPPDNPDHKEFISLFGTGSSSKCTKPFDMVTPQLPVTPEWIEEQDAKDPTKLPNSDVGLDDFVDWETGLPRPDAFEEPTYDPVSPAFAEAAEAIANGTVQHDNPSGNGYVPREIMPNLLVQINNWHEGNTFIDVFTGKEVKPADPPPEESKIDWSKFPGITKAQYEASNNAWGKSAADQAPNINDEISKGEEEFTKLKETINDVPDKTPFVMDFADLVIFPSGGCKGFTVAASLAGQPKSIIVDKHCPPYDAWGRGFIEWILFVATAFQIFHIFRRTLEVV